MTTCTSTSAMAVACGKGDMTHVDILVESIVRHEKKNGGLRIAMGQAVHAERTPEQLT